MISTRLRRVASAPLALSSLLLACGGAPASTDRAAALPPASMAPAARTTDDAAAFELVDATFLERWAATRRFRLGAPTQFAVTPRADAVLFLRSDGPTSFENALYELDVASGEERTLATAASLLGGEEGELSPEERARRERMRLAARGIAGYELSSDGARVLVPLSGKLFVIDRSTKVATALPDDGGYANDAHFSPDGRSVACVREGDLYVVDVATKRQKRLTRDASATLSNGLPEFVAEEEMGRYRGYWWSPDSRSLVFQKTDTTGVETLYAMDPLYPDRAPSTARYPRAGTNNAVVKLAIVPATGGAAREVSWDREALPYVATVVWPKAGPLVALVQDREQEEQRLLRVDPRTGRTEPILVETDEAWLNLDGTVPRFLADGEHYLWATERNGGFELELRAVNDETVRTVVRKELGYEKLLHVDEASGTVWFVASADARETHVYRGKLDGSAEPTRVSASRGLHDGVFGGNGPVWVHTSHTFEGDVAATVSRDAEALHEVRSLAEAPPFRANVELVTVGPRELAAAVIRPASFETGQRYPVIVSVYGGPGHREVLAAGRQYLFSQWLANQGFVVVSVDGRGTPGRGRAFEREIDGHLLDVPLADQVEGLAALGERFRELDLSRVAVYGWSFGGTMSAMAVLKYPEIFHVAVAGAPVTDWRDYDTHYTERFLGLPSAHEDAYAAASPVTFARDLRRPLLIVHGTADDNVYFTHAVELSDALLRAGKPHDFLPLSGFTHMVADPDTTRALYGTITRFLAQVKTHTQ